MATAKRTDASKARKGLDLDEETRAMLGGVADPPPARVATKARDIGMRTEKLRERHDRGYTPRGWRAVGDRLYPRHDAHVPMNTRDRALVEATMEMLTAMLRNVDDFGDGDRQACERFFEHLYGFPFGQSWRRALADLLREQAQAREQQRRGGDAMWPATRTAREVLALVRERAAGEKLPAWLNVGAIETAMGMVNLGGGGGRGKRGGRAPEQCVDWMERAASRKPKR